METNPVHADDGVIDFSAATSPSLASYLPRADVEARVSAAIASQSAGCCLILGEPGSGKTALASRFIHSSRYLHHFLRVGHTEFSLWRDPYAFLVSLGFQLKAAFGAEIFPEVVSLDVQGRVKNVGPTGSVIGIDIERRIVVPWRTQNLSVDLKATSIEGEVVAIRIRELVEDYRQVPLISFRDVAWIEPLRRLRELRPGERVVLWIDGLDEEQFGASGSGDAAGQLRITDILPLGSELKALGNMLLVISSRRGSHLDRVMADGAEVIDLDAPEFESDTLSVLGSFVERELARPDVIQAAAELNWPLEDLRAELNLRGEKNFLYIRQFFEALAGGHGAVVKEGGLPPKLDNIYSSILASLARSQASNYQSELGPVLETLSAALEPLTAEQIRRFAGLEADAVNRALNYLKGFLDTVTKDGEGETTELHTLYHRSFRDCLISAHHTDQAWHVDLRKAHARLASRYFPPGTNGWRDLDDYGFRLATTHLAEGNLEQQVRLIDLMGPDWRAACREHFRSSRAFSRDLERAAFASRGLGYLEASLQTMRLSLMAAFQDDAGRQIPQEVLEVLVLLGQTQAALDSIPARVTELEVINRYASILRGLSALEATPGDLAQQLLRDGMRRLRNDAPVAHSGVEVLLRVCTPADDRWTRQLVLLAFDVLNGTPSGNDSVLALLEVARLAAAFDTRLASRCFLKAVEAIFAEDSPDANHVERLLNYWSASDPREAAQNVLGRAIPASPEAIVGLLTLEVALEKAGDVDRISRRVEWVAEVVLPYVTDAADLSEIFLQIARALMEQSPEEACQWEQRACELMDQIERRSDLWILLAELDRILYSDRASETLGRAWQSFADNGGEHDALSTLVRLQLDVDPDLLDAYLHSVSEPSRQLRLAAECARQLASRGDARALEYRTLAREYLDTILLTAERPSPAGWFRIFYAELARCIDPNQREYCSRVLDGLHIDKASRIRWRLRVLSNLKDLDEAWSWAKETIRVWAEGRSNHNFVDELPAALPLWPQAVVERVVEVLDAVPVPRQRRLLQAALARFFHKQDPAKALVLLDEASRIDPNSEDDQSGLSDEETLAFVAGQAWNIDQAQGREIFSRSEAFLENRLAQIDGRWSETFRYNRFCALAQKALSGSPELVLPCLLSLNELKPEPGVTQAVSAGPGVDEHRIAGMSDRDHLLSIAIGKLMASQPKTASSLLDSSLASAVQSLARSSAVVASNSAQIATKLGWCEQAVTHGLKAEPVALRPLLVADAALAYLYLGAKNKALDLARRTAMGVLEGSSETPAAYSSIYRSSTDGKVIMISSIVVGLARAVGKCLTVMISSGALDESLELLWKAHVLGPDGLYNVLASLPTAIQRTHPFEFEWFQAVDEQAYNLFPRN